MTVNERQLLCTLGPSSFSKPVIRGLTEIGATLFRINLSHTSLETFQPTIEFIQDCTDVPICVDTEGAQIRTGGMANGEAVVPENAIIEVVRESVPGDAKRLNLYPHYILDVLEVGDIISIDFNALLVQVLEIDGDRAQMRVLNGGRVGQNKAVTVQRHIALPPLTEKDQSCVAIALDIGLENFALSFANRAADVKLLRSMIGENAHLISKIECHNGLENLDEIGAVSDALLIDRGDLSREVPLEQIPRIQKAIIRRAKELGRPVYVATNLLETMILHPTPTRAEVNDIYNTLADGADGLVLAAETAIGAYPTRCASMIVRMVREFEARGDDETPLPKDADTSLIPPHGGILIERTAETADVEDFIQLKAVTVSLSDLMDCEQIANGTYSPLTGFMDRETLAAVLANNRLCDGTAWTIPILLQLSPNDVDGFGAGDRIALKHPDGDVHAVMDISEIYPLDMTDVAKKWFGTSSTDHPGVGRFFNGGEVAVAGAVTLVKPVSSSFRSYELSPASSRFIFSHNGWTRVVGFHTRNVCHRAHEHILFSALERAEADGIYVSPVTGGKKRHDFLPGPVLKSYQVLFNSGDYSGIQRLLGGFRTYSRYAGPREAVFTAICRKNMGCSHFIVGRDHTGVGDFYPPDANRKIFDQLGDIGITPIFFDPIGYNAKTKKYESLTSKSEANVISGTQFRNALLAGERVPEWFVRDTIQDMLLDDLAAGRPVFQD